MAFLELTHVEAFYGKIRALKGIDLNVEQGEIVTLIGANGAGNAQGHLRADEARAGGEDHI